ncbi:flagellar motor rotation protein MotB [Lachnospiraceae bacterium KM106-2]|nr:flagellar motor rotation protein MotB [Lachnospiraceae bacterium KM106-2]
MARKKQEEAPQGSPAWMATFSDLMNLLLCFFVLLFSMSSVDAEKFEQVVASLSDSINIFESGNVGVGDGQLISNGISQLNNLGEYFNDMGNSSKENNESNSADPEKQYKEKLEAEQKKVTEELYEEVQEKVENKKIDQYVSVDMDDNYQFVKISMYGAILFDSGDADVKSDAIPLLSSIGDILKSYDNYLIKIEGHTDNVPITHSSVYKNNLWLSSARASTVWEYLTEKKGLDPSTLEASGRSEYDPVADNKTAEGRKKNRRVEIKIYSETKD